jgi:hypothetical protein
MTPRGHIDEAAMNGSVPAGSPRTVLAVPTWRRSTFDDHGAGLAVVGDGEWFVVRQSPSAVAVAYIQNWPSLPAK